MAKQPTLETERLILRPFVNTDAKAVHANVSSKEIASTTINIPHPYEEGMAEEWISNQQSEFEKKKVVQLAIALKDTGELIGCINIKLDLANNRGELGYWTAVKVWGKGYCSEAAQEMMRYGFEELGLNKVFATHMGHNPASGKVMEKIGMKFEGKLEKHVKKWDEYQDFLHYGLTAKDFNEL